MKQDNTKSEKAKTKLSQMLVGTSPEPDEREQSVNTQALDRPKPIARYHNPMRNGACLCYSQPQKPRL